MKEDHFDKEFEQEFDQSTAHVPNGTTAAVDTGVQLSSRASSMAVKLEEKDDDDDCIYCHEEEADDSLDGPWMHIKNKRASLDAVATGSHNYKGVYAGLEELREDDDSDQEIDLHGLNIEDADPAVERDSSEEDFAAHEPNDDPQEEVEDFEERVEE